MHNFNINSQQIDNIKKISIEEKNFRIKNFKLFESAGFPNKRLEDWKFSDFREIINKNFDQVDSQKISDGINKLYLQRTFWTLELDNLYL